MGAAERIPTIGPVTEARICAAFAQACIITADATAGLIGCDVKTLREMTDAGFIRAVRKGAGKTRGYTEGDIRAYLTESAAPCPSGPRGRAAPANQHGQKVVPFSKRGSERERGGRRPSGQTT